MKTVLIVLLTSVVFLGFSQEKKMKIKENGEFTFLFDFNNQKSSGSYIGGYAKEKIDGEKLELPHGQGKFISSTITYDGEWSEGKLNGLGTLKTTTYSYTGNFAFNKKNGKGRIEYSNGEIYDGDWVNDTIQGKGMMIYANKDTYTGEFKNGMRDGKGIYNFQKDISMFHLPKYNNGNFNIYEGVFKENKFSGEGKLITKDGFDLTGTWFDASFTGKGRLYFANGDYWIGDVDENKAMGKGEFFYSNGDVYKGDMKDRVKDGFGKMSFKDGSSYEGNWKNNLYSGKGVFNSTSGKIWDGNFENGDANGEMTVYNRDKTVWASGTFLDSKLHGKGYKIRNGTKWEGYWKEDLPIDSGRVYWVDGSYYVGEWSGNIDLDGSLNYFYQGNGKRIFPSGDIYVGEFQQGRMHGKGKLTTIEGKVYEGDFIMDDFIKPFAPATCKIGNQIWMAENLNIERFRNGDIIYQVTTMDELIDAQNNQQPAWCYYNFDESLGSIYGKLYNRYAINDPRGIEPKGWRLPTAVDFKNMSNALGGDNINTFRKLKAKGTEYFSVSEANIFNKGNNLSGFNAKGSGHIEYSKNGMIEFYLVPSFSIYISKDFRNALMLFFEYPERPNGGGFNFDQNDIMKDYIFLPIRLVKN
jgi:uncharacterized protein (TIGR02145 family)